jgi:hypothetical protein
MRPIRHRRYCGHCRATTNLIKSSFSKKNRIQYYRCNPCNAARMRAYYHGKGHDRMLKAAQKFMRSRAGRAYHRAYQLAKRRAGAVYRKRRS